MTQPLDVFWDRCEGSIKFGTNDCCTALADTILAAGGPDLMAGYRGRYTTALGFARAFRKAGHETLVAACEAAFAAHGEMVDEPEDFDVAMIGHFDLTHQRTIVSPGFFYDGVWLTRTDRGGAGFIAQSLDCPIYRVLTPCPI